MTTPITIRLTLWIWLIAAVLVGNFQLLAGKPAFVIPVLMLTLTFAVLIAAHRNEALRVWLAGLDLRIYLLLHVTRLVGFYVLELPERGLLPAHFAVSAGWSEILVAVSAVLICILPLRESMRRKAILLWNVVGFFGLLFVVITAAQLTFNDTTQLRAFTYLPLGLLPTFLVPLLFSTHVLLYRRLQRAE